MYNRYIPQPDGSFRRSQMPDAVPSAPQNNQQYAPRQQEPPRQEFRPQPEPERREEPVNPQRQPSAHMRPPRQNRPSAPPPRQRKPQQQQEHRDFGVGTFLRQLLPKDFDTEDLLIVLLLLLMSGDCAEDQNFALLTLALYLFM